MAAAWYLSKAIGASTNFVDISIPAPVAISGQYDFTIEFEVQLTGTDLPILHASALDATVNFYFVNSSGNLDIRTTGNTTTVTVNGGDKTQWNKYRVRHFTDSGVPKRQVFYNGVLKATYTLNNIPTAPITYLFKVGNSTRTGNLKTLWFEDVNAPDNNKIYDANLSGGVGTTLPPDGTLNGAMAWVEYDDGIDPGGDTDSSVSLSVPLFGVSANQQSTMPEYSSAVLFGIGLFSAEVNQSSAGPEYDSSVNLGVSLFSALAAQEYSSPNGGASVSFGVALFSAQSEQQSAVPQYSLSAGIGVDLFGASAQQVSQVPSSGATVSIGVPMFSATASQSATVPQYNITASVGVPMFSVFSLSGEFKCVVADGGRLDIPSARKRLDIPATSRKLDITAQSRRIDL